jgi:hypothetical protein
VNFSSGGFRCWGCDAHGGDVVSFLRQRDRLSFKEACQRLGCWDDAPSESVRKIQAAEAERLRQQRLDNGFAETARDRRLRLRDQLHQAVSDFNMTSARLKELYRGAPTDWSSEQETCWSHLRDTLDDMRELKRAYNAAAGLE